MFITINYGKRVCVCGGNYVTYNNSGNGVERFRLYKKHDVSNTWVVKRSDKGW